MEHYLPLSEQTKKLRYRGTKPWSGGLTLTSFGHNEIDSILGGGQPLGTSICIEEDRWTEDLGIILARYWSAEAVSQGQILLIPAGNEDREELPRHMHDRSQDGAAADRGLCHSRADCIGFIDSLPKDMYLEKLMKKKNQQGENDYGESAGVGRTFDSNVILEGENEEDDIAPDEGLKIAWQYRSDIQYKMSGLPTRKRNATRGSLVGESNKMYCHSYDLNDRLVHQYGEHWESTLLFENLDATVKSDVDTTFLHKNIVDVYDITWNRRNLAGDAQCGIHLFKKIMKRIYIHLEPDKLEQKNRDSSNVVRILLLDAPPVEFSIALPLLISYIRTHSLPVVLLFTLRGWNHLSTKAQQCIEALRVSADAVLSVHGFSLHKTPPASEFRDFSGLLTIKKLSLFTFMNYADHKRPLTNRYGFKRDRRKLKVEMLHIPPEEFSSSGQGSVSGGGVRSGAGRSTDHTTADNVGCGSHTSSNLDF